MTDLPSGTCWIEVGTDPEARLHETSTRNNRSLRRVVLDGTPGVCTATALPHLGIDGPPTGG